MFVSECLNVNNKGHLTIGGCDTLELAKEFGTPLYVLDETTIRNVCKAYVKSFEKYYHGNGMPLYASKALSCKELCRIAKEEGLGLDVVSGGEIYTAVQAGFPMEKVHFHGNNKTADEIRFALESNVGKFVVDNLYELELLNEICGEMGKKANISFRIKPGVDAHTHNFIRTGQIDSKFGFALETGEAFEAVKKAQMYDNVNLTELHCHIGSQILTSAAVLVLCTLRMMNLFLTKTIWKRFQRLLRQRLKNTDFLFRISLLSRVVQLSAKQVLHFIKLAAKRKFLM